MIRLLGAVILLAAALPSCSAPGSGGSVSPAPGHVAGVATAGPVCPVERTPPDPACADRPVVGAAIILRDLAGAEVARARTDLDGGFTFTVAPGRYLLEPQPVEGLMGTAPPLQVTVEAGGETSELAVSYDTGIR
jgi:hypothetical protein